MEADDAPGPDSTESDAPGRDGTETANGQAGTDAPDGDRDDGTRGASLMLSAVVGGLATILLGFVPLSPLIGGGLAGYLRGGPRGGGLKIGAAAGFVAAVPTFVALVVLSLFVVAGPGGSSAVRFLLLVFLGLGFVAVYVVGLSIAGGYLGVAVRQRQQGRRDHSEPPADASGAGTSAVDQ